MRDLASSDELTGTLNRRAVLEQLDKELARVTQTAASLTIALLDIDLFREFNDAFGHQIGDQVLHQCVERIRTRTEGGDCIGRYGGEEFLLLFPNIASGSERIALERIRQHVAKEPFLVDGRTIDVTVSIGCRVTSGECLGADELIKRADLAMY